MIVDDKQVTNAGETATRDYIVRQLEITVDTVSFSYSFFISFFLLPSRHLPVQS